MAKDYIKTRKTADKLIKENGVTGTLTRAVAASFDPATGTLTPASDATQSVTCVITQNKKKYNTTDSVILASSHVALISGADPTSGDALSFDPVAGDNLTVLSAVWKINAIDEVQPGGVILIYRAYVSK